MKVPRTKGGASQVGRCSCSKSLESGRGLDVQERAAPVPPEWRLQRQGKTRGKNFSKRVMGAIEGI